MCFGVTPLTTGVSHVPANFGVAGRTGLQPVIKVRLASSGMGTPRPGPAPAPSALGCRGVLAGTSGRALNEAFNQDRCQTHRGGRRRLHFPSRLPASPCHLLGGKSPFFGGGGAAQVNFPARWEQQGFGAVTFPARAASSVRQRMGAAGAHGGGLGWWSETSFGGQAGGWRSPERLWGDPKGRAGGGGTPRSPRGLSRHPPRPGRPRRRWVSSAPGAALRHGRAAPGRELRFFWVSVGARWGQRQIQMSRGDQPEAAAPASHSGWARQTDPRVCPAWA